MLQPPLTATLVLDWGKSSITYDVQTIQSLVYRLSVQITRPLPVVNDRGKPTALSADKRVSTQTTLINGSTANQIFANTQYGLAISLLKPG